VGGSSGNPAFGSSDSLSLKKHPPKKANGGTMSKIITLPSGATVTLKDPSLLRVKDRNRVIKAGDNLEGDVAKGIAFSEALIACIVEEWSLDLLPPSVKLESLEEMEIPDYDALVEASQDLSKTLFPALGKTKETESDPKALTEGSSI
jgi:hypothetical protein